MSLAASVASGMQAALLLARGRTDGLRYVEADLAGAARSFWAGAICLPAFICLRLLTWTEAGAPPHAAHVLALDLISFGVGWCAFAVLSHRLVGTMGLGARWPRFIAMWNWCNVVQYLLLVMFSIPGLLGAPPLFESTESATTFGPPTAMLMVPLTVRMASRSTPASTRRRFCFHSRRFSGSCA